MSLKLLVDNKTRKVLFAEAGKDLVDLLFALLRFPIGALVMLASAGTMPGSVGHLYKSVDDIDASYFLPNIYKGELLGSDLPLTDTDDGYVNGLATYMVTDGLEVTPVSAISSITLINRFRVGNDVELAEKIVAVGDDEVRSSIGLQATPLQVTNYLVQTFLLVILTDRLRLFFLVGLPCRRPPGVSSHQGGAALRHRALRCLPSEEEVKTDGDVDALRDLQRTL